MHLVPVYAEILHLTGSLAGTRHQTLQKEDFAVTMVPAFFGIGRKENLLAS
jgi:hypothetical protein|tara:strand:+ start:692 stop:844 length:153 start_codon:yes stop_codon:yes gene_type:complete